MLNEIEKISSVHVRQQLQELWRNDCKKQEEKSQNLREVKKSWFEKYPTRRIRHLPRRQTKLRDAESAEMRGNRQTDGETIAAPEKPILQ